MTATTQQQRNANLTPLEIEILAAWPTDYDTAEQLLEDNCSWATVTELSALTLCSVEQVKGIVGSLIKKGLAAAEENLLVLTDEGIHAKFSI